MSLMHNDIADSVRSPPPCGEGLGVGAFIDSRDQRQDPTPPATLRAAGDPPHKGEGETEPTSRVSIVATLVIKSGSAGGVS